jgi:hypothetical protein
MVLAYMFSNSETLSIYFFFKTISKEEDKTDSKRKKKKKTFITNQNTFQRGRPSAHCW